MRALISGLRGTATNNRLVDIPQIELFLLSAKVLFAPAIQPQAHGTGISVPETILTVRERNVITINRQHVHDENSLVVVLD
mmetsp:Transcript_4683/g.20051  ORF Transcript_4683/g.20051 Transcript_4683/m.20051 type:complete len:81 (-) Transcript_4683:2350-2592(-)